MADSIARYATLQLRIEREVEMPPRNPVRFTYVVRPADVSPNTQYLLPPRSAIVVPQGSSSGGRRTAYLMTIDCESVGIFETDPPERHLWIGIDGRAGYVDEAPEAAVAASITSRCPGVIPPSGDPLDPMVP